MGDQLLRHFADILKSSFNAECCSRFSSDHFCVITDAADVEKKLNDIIAADIIEEIWRMYIDGQAELYVVVKMAEVLEAYFEKKGATEEHIYALIILVNAYQNIPSHAYEKRCMEYYKKLREYKNYMDNIVKHSVRKELYDSYLGMAVFVAEKPETSFERCLEFLDEEYNFFVENDIKDYLHFTDDEAREYIDVFFIRMVASNIIFYYKQEPDNPHYHHAMEFMADIYKRHTQRAADDNDIYVRLFTAYHKLRYLLGEIGAKESFRLHRIFWDYNNDYIVKAEDAEKVRERKFHLMVFFVPTMIRLYRFAEQNNELINISYIATIVNEWVEYLKHLKKVDNEAYVSRRLYQSVMGVSGYVDDADEFIELLLGIMAQINIDGLFKANFIHLGAESLLKYIYSRRPEMLVGVCGCRDEDEVEERFSEIMYYLGNATFIYNCGYGFIGAVSNIVIRNITDEEKDILSENIYISSAFLQKDEKLKEYVPMVMGFGKNYDETGFPNDYRYKEHENALLVDIMHIADGFSGYYDIVDNDENMGAEQMCKKMIASGKYNNEILELIAAEGERGNWKIPANARDRLAESLFGVING